MPKVSSEQPDLKNCSPCVFYGLQFRISATVRYFTRSKTEAIAKSKSTFLQKCAFSWNNFLSFSEKKICSTAATGAAIANSRFLHTKVCTLIVDTSSERPMGSKSLWSRIYSEEVGKNVQGVAQLINVELVEFWLLQFKKGLTLLWDTSSEVSTEGWRVNETSTVCIIGEKALRAKFSALKSKF